MLAYLVAALSPNMEVANAALPTYVVTLLFFAGFLLRWKCALSSATDVCLRNVVAFMLLAPLLFAFTRAVAIV